MKRSFVNHIRLIHALVATVLLGILSGSAQAQQFVPLWEQGHIPDTHGPALKDSIVNERYYQVGAPGFYAFFPSNQENTGCAVLICPGGGYTHITYKSGGITLAKWFNVMGVSAFVLLYRLPNERNLIHRALAPLQDAQRAMRIIGSNAGSWHIDPERIGVMGASAGGHLAASLGADTADVSAIGDSLDHYAFRPDFMILVSPVITMGKYAHQGSRKSLLGTHPTDKMIKRYSPKLHVTDHTPSCFIADAFNDRTVNPQNSLLFYQSLLNHHISTSFHVFPQGGHAIGLRNNPGSTKLWTALCESWLREMKFIIPPSKGK